MQCGVIIIKQHDPDCVLRSLKSEAWKGSNENKLPTHFEKEPIFYCSPSRHFALRMQNGSVVCNKVACL